MEILVGVSIIIIIVTIQVRKRIAGDVTGVENEYSSQYDINF